MKTKKQCKKCKELEKRLLMMRKCFIRLSVSKRKLKTRLMEFLGEVLEEE